MASRADRRDAVRPIDVAEEIAAAVRVLSRHRLGGIIVWDPIAAVEGGVVLDARVSRELLLSIALPDHINELHRGAVVIRGHRVERAGVPITWPNVVTRAADLAFAIAIAVDEDTGEIRMANRSGHVEVVEVGELAEVLRGCVLGTNRSG